MGLNSLDGRLEGSKGSIGKVLWAYGPLRLGEGEVGGAIRGTLEFSR